MCKVALVFFPLKPTTRADSRQENVHVNCDRVRSSSFELKVYLLEQVSGGCQIAVARQTSLSCTTKPNVNTELLSDVTPK